MLDSGIAALSVETGWPVVHLYNIHVDTATTTIKNTTLPAVAIC
ncbi:hypothetical protein [Mycobacterium kyorinense]|nr:hypothetical protein [Mycobacterium kyorinense]